jgi:hypothetical protein
MEKRLTYTIEGYEGVWELDRTYVTELGFLMSSFYNDERGVWMNVNMGHFDDLILEGTKADRLTITKDNNN